MNAWAQGEGQPGLGYILFFDRAKDETTQGSRPPARQGVGGARPVRQQHRRPSAPRPSARSSGSGRATPRFFVAGDPEKFVKFAGQARTKLGQDLKLIDEHRFEFAWIVDFPMFEWNEDDKKIDFSHNPFSMPQGGLEALTSQDPADDQRVPVRRRLQRL